MPSRSVLSLHPLGDVAMSVGVGAVGGLVAAFLAAFTEPVLNRIAVRRMTLKEAMAEVRLGDILLFFRTVLALNLLKFPFYEAVDTLTASWTFLPIAARGALAAFIYTSLMLPLLNYRYMASLRMEIRRSMLYQAYRPTLLRDLVYGSVRTVMRAKLQGAFSRSPLGGALAGFVEVGVACLASAPFNELRAFQLQTPERWLPPKEFFKPDRFLRSALLGSLIPAVSLAVGRVVMTKLWHLLMRVHVVFGGWAVPSALLLATAIAAVVWLERERQYYDPYALPRILRRLEAEASRERLRQAARLAPAGGSDVHAGGPEGSDLDIGSLEPASASTSLRREAKLPSFGALGRFIAPAACNVIANSSMSSVDKAFLGQLSTLQLAAMGPAAAVFDSSSYLLTFLNTATLSRLVAARDAEEARLIRSHAFVITTASGLALGAFLIVHAVSLTRHLGATHDMLHFSVMYLRIRALGAAAERGTSVSSSFCLAERDGTTPLLVTLIGVVANTLGDALLCPRYGLEGVAVTSVLASLICYAYLIRTLQRKGLWPRPLSWPRGRCDIVPFLQFAGPVLFAVFLKTVVLANMTTAACTLGHTAAAAHQIFQGLFLLSSVALGNPCSWAAQSFLPPLLADGEVGEERKRTGQRHAQLAMATLARLVVLACASSFVMCSCVVVFCQNFAWIATSDEHVIHEMASNAWAVVPFCALYPLLLTMEGALYAAQRRNHVLVLSSIYWVLSSAIVRALRRWEVLSLGTLWLSSGIACGVAAAITAVLASRAMFPRRRLAGPHVHRT